MPETRERATVNLSWLIKLRWVAVVGQMLTIGGATLLLGIDLLVWPLMVVIGLTVVSNLVLIYWFQQETLAKIPHSQSSFDNTMGLVMTMDLLSLATLLFATGGPTNPFCLFFFVNLSLSALVLSQEWAWALNVLSIVCFAGLLVWHVPVDELEMGLAFLPVGEKQDWSLSQIGLLAAYATCSSVIVYFMTRVSSELRKQELSLRQALASRSQNEKLEALGTLAAGAAHELATPLTTIALVAKDVEQSLRSQSGTVAADDDLIDDVGLIRQQLDRCKSILDRMASHAGETVGEMTQRIDIKTLYEDVSDGLVQCETRINVQFYAEEQDRSHDCHDRMVQVPIDALSQAIRGLVQNALDASEPNQPISIHIHAQDENMVWVITDQGCGMTQEVLRRVSEPFFTTKEPGKGMGLGVFLARNVIERLDGHVEFQSRGGQPGNTGTKVTVTLPCLATNESQEQGAQ